MPNKKTVKRNKRNSKRSRGRNRKGGFWGLFDDKHNTGNTECDPNKLANLKSSYEIKKNIDTCCPKTWYGRKNNSPYCKQLDLNYKAASQESKMETDSTNQMLKTNRFNVNNDNTIRVIDCKSPNLYNSKDEIQQYIENCKCNNLSWYNINGKKNCNIVKTRLEKLNENQVAEERPTEVTNPLQNNGYMPVNQTDNENEEQERPTEVTNPYPKNEYVQPQEKPEDQNQRPSLYSPEGGKRRKTKKHFNKRSIKKRKGRNSKGRKH